MCSSKRLKRGKRKRGLRLYLTGQSRWRINPELQQLAVVPELEALCRRLRRIAEMAALYVAQVVFSLSWAPFIRRVSDLNKIQTTLSLP